MVSRGVRYVGVLKLLGLQRSFIAFGAGSRTSEAGRGRAGRWI